MLVVDFYKIFDVVVVVALFVMFLDNRVRAFAFTQRANI